MCFHRTGESEATAPFSFVLAILVKYWTMTALAKRKDVLWLLLLSFLIDMLL